MNRKQRRAALKGNVSPAVGEAEALNRRGLALAGQGGGDDARFLGEAAELFRQACRHHPTFAEAYNNLGASRHRQGRHAEAAEACRNALTLKPDDASALYNLALALNAMGRLEDAAACYRKALTVRPDDPSTLNNLGIALSALNRPDEAETVFLSLLPLRADDPEAYNNLGAALAAQGKFDQGMTAYKTAITLRPHYVEAHTNLSSALFEQGQFALAAKAARTALAFQPESTVAHNNLGVALQAMGRLREAERAFRTAISLDPDFSEAHYDLAITLLQGGFFPEGWREHEWRWSGAVENLTPRQFPQPRWAGEPLAGRTILFYAEQGMGDILQFARYTSCLAALGGRVILEVYRPLVRLLTSVPGAAQVVAIGDPLPAFDVHLPLMSAPHLLGTTVQNIPTDIPYVHPDDALATVWKNRLSGLTGLKVGVVWSGDPRPDNPRAHAVDRRRSLSLSQLEPLLAMPGVSFVSLQKGSPAAQLTTVAPEIRPLDRMDDVSDFADTAALVANLDLVISVDTSVAHLAGALGKPVWILSRFDGCWRWLTDRDDSPWYPTARLFRQETPGEWKNVVARVAAALEKHMLTVTPGLDPGVHTPPPSQTPHPHNDGNTRIKSGNDETRFETGATINAAFDEALQHHQAGRLDDAETLYRLSIANDPQHARSHYNLGLIALQRGRHETAVEKIRQALDLHPANPEAWTNLGIALQALGRLEDAIVAFHASLDQCPDDARVHYNLAIALGLSGKHQDAIPSFLSAITLNPALDEAYNNLAVAMVSLGRNEDAIPAFQRAIVLHPDDADTRFNLGMALHCLDRVKEAATAFQATTEINPLRAEAHGALGAMHLQMGNPVETERACRRAITLAPDNASARSNLAAALFDQGRFQTALDVVKTAIALRPDFAIAYDGLAVTLQALGRLTEARRAFGVSLTLAPDNAGTHYNLSTVLLLEGDYANGWREFEWRWRKSPGHLPLRQFAKPLWNGENLAGRTILLHGEQGLGDILQFARYARPIAALGARVILEVASPLTRLLTSIPKVSQVVATGEALPDFDYHLPMMSAPDRLGTTLDSIPAEIPYVSADAHQVDAWRRRLSVLPGLKVGLVWAGNARPDLPRAHLVDRRRSMALSDMAPLLSLPGISFVSLQKGETAAQLRGIASASRPHDWMDEVADFADTAALVANLDLIIAVDTSIVHLAGAMGKPVWILSRYDGCWRWLADRDDSPWYPTARLFRQTAPGDWDDVMARVATELEQLASLSLRHSRESGTPIAIVDPRLRGDDERKPDVAQLFALAVKSFEAGRLDEAAPLYRRILTIAPDHADSMHHLGLIALRSKHLTEAAGWIAAALAHQPDYLEAYNNLGIVRLEQGALATAMSLFRRAVRIKPDYAAGLSNWGSSLGEQERWEDATVLCRQAIVLQPGFAGAYSNLGVIFSEMGRPADAEAAFRIAITLSPNHTEAQYNLGTSLLAQGKYEEGWKKYEWRLHGDNPEVTPRRYPQPAWSGEDLSSRTLLLYGEQGLGDFLQFSRYATLLASRGARVIVEAYPSLARLLSSVPGVALVVGDKDTLPDFDYHLSVMSASYRLGTTLDSIPATIPYIAANPAHVELWSRRLAGLPGLKVGLVWSGDPRPHARRAHAIDRRRSMTLEQMSPLLSVPNVSFVSLQKGGPAAQLAGIPLARRPHDWMDEIGDFADTAALVATLDLVISVDTSVVHLAGALGKPVWILSRFDGCWRWLTDRDDSPWYPTARLFRQKKYGDWAEVIERVATELEQLASSSLRHSRESGNPIAGMDPRLRGDDEKAADVPLLFADALHHHQAGHLSEAKSLYLRILDAEPTHFDSLHHLGLIALWSDAPEEATSWISQAIAFDRGHVGAHINLGKALDKMGRIHDALVVFRMAIELDPNDVDARYYLGVTLHDMERPDEAGAAYRDALALKPDFALALTNLGGALGEMERHDEAVTLARRALAVDPEQARARSNLGASLHELHRIDEAIACYRQAIALGPELPETHHNLATALLLQGQYEEGLREYEWRWKGAIPGVAPRPFDRPLWQGGPLSGRTILLHGEQGLGDVLQFARYASLLAARGARVILEVYPLLTRLLSSVPGVAHILAVGDPFPAYDCHLPLMSAPLMLGTRIDNVPADGPYVTANSTAVGLWRERLSSLPGLKVGLVWAGDPRTHSPRNHAVDRRRSMTLDKLKPLLTIPGISFISLQKGEAAHQIQGIGAESQIFDVMDEMEDFADTAALVANLDLVIAVDTSVAHLAGALAKPVWLLNRFNGCWRWLDDREGSPWYPTVRLFRQPSPGNWDDVIKRVAVELAGLSEDGKIAQQTIEELFTEAVRHHQENRFAEADALYRRILARDPQHPVILHHRGVIAQQTENPTAAVAFIRQALCSRPAYMEAWTNLGTALRDLGERALAEPCLRRAIQLRPDIAEAHNNLGSLCNELGRLDDAVLAFRAALALQPDNPEIHCNLAATLLERGDYAEGWREHEWRLHHAVTWAKPQPLPQPLWTGEDLKGRTILLRSEQGLGDDLQFARYATPVAALGATVILEVQAPLTRLLATVPGVSQVVAKGDALPAFDCYLSLMSAPHLLGTTLETIPSGIPYVTPDAAATAAWKNRLAPLPGLKVGLVWAGDPRPHDRRANAIDRRRSLPLAKLSPLLMLPGISFVSLQKGEAAGQIDDLPLALRPFDVMGEMADFADTAALVANLDLVISVDTSVVHLAGALDKPVWILSRYDGCWRWLVDRDNSPWYPAARLFRQIEPGNWDEVVARVSKALEPLAPPLTPPLSPNTRTGETVPDLLPRAMERHRAGRFDEAAALYRRILAIEPDNVFTLHHLGLVARQAGDFATTERLIGRAIAIAPDYAEALCNLGAALNDQGKAGQALTCCQRAVILKPDYAKAHNNLGKSFKDLGKAADAATSYRRATILDPQFVMAFSNLSAALQDLGRLDDALACCERALVLEPDGPIAHNNRGVVLSQQGDSEGAIRHYGRAALLAPDYAEMHANLGMVLLLGGNFTDGWREYEWRWSGGMRGLRPRNFSQPRWAGDNPNGRTILLYAEQGLGDSLQFARYATEIAASGAQVILEVQSPLKRLLATVPGVTQVVAMGETLPSFDCHLPMMSAPFILGTTVETVPAGTPYVTADAAQSEAWRDRLASLPGLKVGLVWAGNPRVYDPDANLIDQRRSMTLAQMAPLLRVPGASFVSLQKDPPPAQLHAIAPDLRPLDWMDEMGDFADTAALIANLDLVIAVDTSVVHLAGALGKPVWIASRFDGCWRWLTDRDDSPWYPTARLFRQTTAGDWDGVVARMAEALACLPSDQKPLTRSLRAHPLPQGARVDPAHLFAKAMADQQAGRLEEAVTAYRAVIALSPDVAASYINLAVALAALDRHTEAAEVFRQAIALDPSDSKIRYNLGLTEQSRGNDEEAAAAFQASLDLDPTHAKAYTALGAVQVRLGRPVAAATACRAALAINPIDAEAYGILAASLFDQGRFGDAIAPAKTAIVLRPDFAEAFSGLALTWQIIGRFEDAGQAYRTAITLRPDDAEAHHNLAMALLQTGHYGDGWREYEWRWKDGAPKSRSFARPRWTGEDLTGQTILLWAEQGLGDVLQFVRYAPLIARHGAQVILEVHPSLKRLLESLPGVAQVVAEGEPLPPFDYHLPLLSAPLLLGTTVETIPADGPYLHADAHRTKIWGQRLAASPGLKVGLVWAGNPRSGNPRNHLVDGRRSISLRGLTPLLSTPGIQLISLQKGEAAAQIGDLAPHLRPLDLMDAVDDFADTAGLVANLDLVISVDTAVAHLAGAMGKPVWILSRFDGCWRWLTDRDDSPWYPTARLFRQTIPGDWDGVVERVADALSRFAPSRPLAKEREPFAAQCLGRAIRHHEAGEMDEAEDAYGQALAVKPDYPEAMTNLGCLLRTRGRLEEAFAIHQSVVQRWPGHASLWNNFGITLKDMVRPAAAADAFRQAIALNPKHAQAHANLAHVLLLSGLYAEGWREYEWRWNGAIDYLNPRDFAQPQWTGENLDGRTLLLHAEQGLGDTLQFVRYATLIANQGARVILEAHPPLKRLLTSVPGVTQVLAGGDSERLPSFDYHLPLLSAPHLFGTTLETIPADVPYLTPDPALTARWGARLAPLSGVKVGLVWAGEPWAEHPEAHAIDQRRSVSLARLLPLLSIPGIRFVSLQKGLAAAQLRDIAEDVRPIDAMDDVSDFADTAALVANLDLVISVDTAVAHLAGALGKPVWILSRFDGCWRWLTGREDSPWYPTARLFRQTTPGDWDTVIERVAQELKKHVLSVMPVLDTGIHVPASNDDGQSTQLWIAGSSPAMTSSDCVRTSNRGDTDYAALFALAVTHHQTGRLDEAEALYRRLLALGSETPGHAEASCNLGMILRQRNKLADAIARFRHALQRKPDYPDALNNLGLACNDLGNGQAAVACYERALRIQPMAPRTRSNLGVALQGLGRIDEAVAAYRHAIAMEPDLAGPHYNLAQILLLQGAFEEGWREHEWLWRGAVENLPQRTFPSPKWDGGRLQGKTILLYAEQGLGDALQFARYATDIAALGARVILEVHPPLKRLLRSVPGVAEILAIGESLPNVDYHLPLMGAPFRLGTRLESIPATIPYVAADSVEAATWKTRLQALPGLKIGLVWAGDPRPGDLRAHVIDSRRSIALTDLIPLLSAPGATFISLQKGAATAQIRDLPAALRPRDWMDEIDDFAGTAALLANLDLVISVDTAVAHLAGALGKPVWILSRFDGCWRWLQGRDDSPWYPTARLFRQTTAGGWADVIARVAAELEKHVLIVTPGHDESRSGVHLGVSAERNTIDHARLFALAVKHHQAGRLDDAEALYDRILQGEPDNIGCLFHLGLIAQQRGRHVDALGLLSRAADRNSQIPGLHDTLGTSFLAIGRVTDAIAAHRRALAIKPDFFEAAYNLGNAYQILGDRSQAKACFQRTITLRPDLPEPYNNLGNLLSAEKNFSEAMLAYRRAIAIHPAFAAAHNNLGNVAKEQDDLSAAAICFERALHLDATYVEAHYNLANTLLEAGALDAAVAAFRRAVTIRPDLTEAYNNLGSALHLQGSVDRAVVCFERTLRLDPGFPEAHSNLGTVLRDRGDLDHACVAYRQAIACDPGYALAHSNLGVTLLLQGNYAEGLPEFEWRQPRPGTRQTPRIDLPPRWTGEDPAGHTILLQAEQGLGDVLQFARYAGLIAERGGRVILEVYPPLKRLLASVPGVAQILTADDALPAGIDWHLPLMSAPYVMGTRVETIPATIPYLTADAGLVSVWKKRLARLPGLKVGLVWAGDPRAHDPRAHAVDRRRSIALTQLAPLLAVPGIDVISLQKGAPVAQLADIAPELRPLDLMDDVSDFADTAALIATLDLVISVDTSVVHLAGAMGKPVWILSRFDGCWRWLTEREDSPWYPTARLFRQTTSGDWNRVIARVTDALASLERR